MEEADKGMIDDHDRCEWVTIFSGTGSPELFRMNCCSVAVIVVVTRDYFDSTASNWNTSAHSCPLASHVV